MLRWSVFVACVAIFVGRPVAGRSALAHQRCCCRLGAAPGGARAAPSSCRRRLRCDCVSSCGRALIARLLHERRGAAPRRCPPPRALSCFAAYPALPRPRSPPGRSIRSSCWRWSPRRLAKWIDNFGVQILIYVMLGWGLNIVVGLAGLLDLGYVAFYAVGAYAYALLVARSSAWASGSACRSPAPRGALGHHARLPGAAAARRLSRHRDAGLRRDHPPGADQLGRPHQRLRRHFRHPAPELLRPPFNALGRTASRRVRARVRRRSSASSSSTT